MQLCVAGTQSTCEAPPFPAVYKQPFFLCCGPGGCSSRSLLSCFYTLTESFPPGTEEPWEGSARMLTSYEVGRYLTCPEQTRGRLCQPTLTRLCVCECILWHLSSHSFLQPLSYPVLLKRGASTAQMNTMNQELFEFCQTVILEDFIYSFIWFSVVLCLSVLH